MLQSGVAVADDGGEPFVGDGEDVAVRLAGDPVVEDADLDPRDVLLRDYRLARRREIAPGLLVGPHYRDPAAPLADIGLEHHRPGKICVGSEGLERGHPGGRVRGVDQAPPGDPIRRMGEAGQDPGFRLADESAPGNGGIDRGEQGWAAVLDHQPGDGDDHGRVERPPRPELPAGEPAPAGEQHPAAFPARQWHQDLEDRCQHHRDRQQARDGHPLERSEPVQNLLAEQSARAHQERGPEHGGDQERAQKTKGAGAENSRGEVGREPSSGNEPREEDEGEPPLIEPCRTAVDRVGREEPAERGAGQGRPAQPPSHSEEPEVAEDDADGAGDGRRQEIEGATADQDSGRDAGQILARERGGREEEEHQT